MAVGGRAGEDALFRAPPASAMRRQRLRWPMERYCAVSLGAFEVI